MNPATGELTRTGRITVDPDGQVVFRLRDADCAACTRRCSGKRVREVVMKDFQLAVADEHEACLHWSRSAVSFAGIALYGLPLAGLIAGCLVADASALADPAAALFASCGLLLGMAVAFAGLRNRRVTGLRLVRNDREHL